MKGDDFLYAFEQERAQMKQVFLIDGTRIKLEQNKILGKCRSRIHPGTLTKRLMLEHDCIGKQCPFFQKNEAAAYWINDEARKKKKAENKAERDAKRKKEKQALLRKEKLLGKIRNVAEAHGSDIVVTDIQCQKKGSRELYLIWYVSPNQYDDSENFPKFKTDVNFLIPNAKQRLVHVKDQYGNYVTTSQYRQRK